MLSSERDALSVDMGKFVVVTDEFESHEMATLI